MSRIINSKDYSGTLILESVAKYTGISVDIIYFLASQLIAFFLAFVYQHLSIRVKLSSSVKHCILFVPGVIISYLSFGNQANHLLVLSMLCYISLCTCSPSWVHIVVLFIAIMHLSYLHLLRQFNDYGAYTFDVTGPMMIMVQKVTSLAFCIHDGFVDQRSLNPEQLRYAVRRLPTLLEFISYNFQFLTIICGPLVYYNDYIEFIKEENFSRYSDKTSKEKLIYSGWPFVVKKFASCVFFAIMHIVYTDYFPFHKAEDERFLRETSFWTLLLFLYVLTLGARLKYYHAWKFGETICNAAGLGFNGFDANNKQKWDLLDPFDFSRFEFALNLKQAIDAWNKTTQTWLRRTAYDRITKYRTLATYTFSALWHGFYPGYYLTFLSGALFSHAARIVRRRVRDRFQSTRNLSLAYDFITFVITAMILSYSTFPFILLDLKVCLRIYIRLYFYGHILALLGIILLPCLFTSSKTTNKSNKTKANIL